MGVPNSTCLETHVYAGHVGCNGQNVDVLLTCPTSSLEAVMAQAHRPLGVTAAIDDFVSACKETVQDIYLHRAVIGSRWCKEIRILQLECVVLRSQDRRAESTANGLHDGRLVVRVPREPVGVVGRVCDCRGGLSR